MFFLKKIKNPAFKRPGSLEKYIFQYIKQTI